MWVGWYSTRPRWPPGVSSLGSIVDSDSVLTLPRKRELKILLFFGSKIFSETNYSIVIS